MSAPRAAGRPHTSRSRSLVVSARRTPGPASQTGGDSSVTSKGPLPFALPSFQGWRQQKRAPPPPPPPPQLPPVPGFVAPTLWITYATYVYFLLISPDLPGEPVYALTSATLDAVTASSLDFFFVTPILHDVFGIPGVPAPPVHPVDLALFNFVNAWSFLFLGLLAKDSRSGGKAVLPTWTGQMFLTNLFLLPWLASRAATKDSDSSSSDALTPITPPSIARLAFSPGLGVLGGLVGALSVGWFVLGQGIDAGDASARVQHMVDSLSTDRLQLAFVVDCVLYAAAQAWLIRDEQELLRLRGITPRLPAWATAVPLFGLAAWLSVRPNDEE